jgi:hypothetical protein
MQIIAWAGPSTGSGRAHGASHQLLPCEAVEQPDSHPVYPGAQTIIHQARPHCFGVFPPLALQIACAKNLPNLSGNSLFDQPTPEFTQKPLPTRLIFYRWNGQVPKVPVFALAGYDAASPPASSPGGSQRDKPAGVFARRQPT